MDTLRIIENFLMQRSVSACESLITGAVGLDRMDRSQSGESKKSIKLLNVRREKLTLTQV